MTASALAVAATVTDPEMPMLTLVDLGVLRDVAEDGEHVTVTITPTYSGCPATEVIERDVLEAIDAAGLGPARVTLRRAPAWTTDWISDAGRRKLLDYGIAPPGPVDASQGAPIRFFARNVACPRCGAARTERLSAFGSTACKALYRCLACREPFEYFKPL